MIIKNWSHPIVIIGVLTVIGLIIDWVGQSLGAKKAGQRNLELSVP